VIMKLADRIRPRKSEAPATADEPTA
jgi:hypothetical protein